MELEKDCAILLGNGLNLYAKTKNQDDTNTSWKDLLKELSGNSLDEKIFDDNSGITYPEIFEMIKMQQKDIKNNTDLKKRIISNMKNWKGTEFHSDFIKFTREQKIPILVTNYDNCLLDEQLEKATQKKGKEIPKVRTIANSKNDHPQKYPYFSYYADSEISDVLNEFAIWHIHGFCYYKPSLIIGFGDYVSALRNLSKYFYQNDDHIDVSKDDWIGKNSWLDIFLNKKLYIIGLGLDSQEIDLRWLLLERNKYLQAKGLQGKELKEFTNFVYCKDKDKIPIGKKNLFDSLYINIIEKESYDDIFEEWTLNQ